MNGVPPFSKRIPATLGAEYLAGATLTELGEQYGVSFTTIRNALRSLGIALRRRGGRTGSAILANRKADPASVLRRFDAGDTLVSIGIAHGITRERVRQIAAEHGRTPRSQMFTPMRLL